MYQRVLQMCCPLLVVALLAACTGRDRAPPEVPGVDLARLTSVELNRYRTVLQKELSPCGGRQTLEQSLRASDCPIARHAAKFVAYRVEQDDTLEEISERYLARYGSASREEIDIEGAPILGNADAPVTIVVFSDFQCPFCARVAALLRTTVEENDAIRLVFLNFPIPGHPMSMNAAVAGLAAHRQQRFWPLHDLMFANRTRLSDELILAMAEELGLDMVQFQNDLLDPAIERQVRAEKAQGIELGIRGTPAVFINGRRFTETLDRLDEAIEEEITRAGMNQPAAPPSQSGDDNPETDGEEGDQNEP